MSPTTIILSIAVSLVTLVIGLAIVEIMRRRGFDPVAILARPFDPPSADAASSEVPS